MADEYRHSEEVVTKVEDGETKNGKPCLNVHFAGNQYPDQLAVKFPPNKEIIAIFKSSGPGTYKITRMPNEYNGKTKWKIAVASKIGNQNPVVVKQAEVKQSKTGDDIRRAVAFKGAIDVLKGFEITETAIVDKARVLTDAFEAILKGEKPAPKKEEAPKEEVAF